MTAFWMFLNAGTCALEAAMFSVTGNPFDLFLAVACGFIALALLLQETQ